MTELHKENQVHCWKGFTDEDGKEYTCLLEDCHEGNCSPVPDENIGVEFSS